MKFTFRQCSPLGRGFCHHFLTTATFCHSWDDTRSRGGDLHKWCGMGCRRPLGEERDGQNPVKAHSASRVRIYPHNVFLISVLKQLVQYLSIYFLYCRGVLVLMEFQVFKEARYYKEKIILPQFSMLGQTQQWWINGVGATKE